jgi:hypothetical protein
MHDVAVSSHYFMLPRVLAKRRHDYGSPTELRTSGQALELETRDPGQGGAVRLVPAGSDDACLVHRPPHWDGLIDFIGYGVVPHELVNHCQTKRDLLKLLNSLSPRDALNFPLPRFG